MSQSFLVPTITSEPAPSKNSTGPHMASMVWGLHISSQSEKIEAAVSI